MSLRLALIDVFPSFAVDGEVRTIEPAQITPSAGIGCAEDGEVVTLGVEFLGKGQAVGWTKIDAERTSLAYFGPDKDCALTRALFGAGVAHGALSQTNRAVVFTTSTVAIK